MIFNQPHKDNVARHSGRIVADAMEQIMSLPDEFRDSASLNTSIKTVDGHAWSIIVQYDGYEGPDRLPR